MREEDWSWKERSKFWKVPAKPRPQQALFRNHLQLHSYIIPTMILLLFQSFFVWPSRISIALDIARGMAFLHGMMPPIVHRDLKSPNILMTINPKTGRYRAKVADFGLSRSLDFSRELDGRALEGHNPVWLAPFASFTDIFVILVFLHNVSFRCQCHDIDFL